MPALELLFPMGCGNVGADLPQRPAGAEARLVHCDTDEARTQKARPDANGSGRANQDRHTDGSSRAWFHRGIGVLARLGFECRVLFYAAHVAAALYACPVMAGAQSAALPSATVFPMSRDSIVARIAELQRIHTPEGIEVVEPVEVNGTTQWISIRGLHRNNPVLLSDASARPEWFRRVGGPARASPGRAPA